MKMDSGQSSPFILYPRKNIEEVRRCVIENYGRIKYELPFLNAICVEIPKEKVQAIRTNRRIAAMSEDIAVSKLPTGGLRPRLPPETGRAALSRPRPLPCLRSGGAGVAIAVIDTGVMPHYDLTKPFSRITAFRDFVNGKTLPYDDDGHGTHVAGIAAGNGFVSRGLYAGTAPQSAVVALKALDREGNGNASDILAAMQWVYDHHREYHIRVVNLSLGVVPTAGTPAIDPLELGAGALALCGLSVIAAAGNSGPGKNTITSPGTSPLVLTVGAADQSHVAEFSSRGPAPGGIPKPDFIAPGVDIVSLSWKNCKDYLMQSGTSMAAPYVSGLAADYYSCRPDASPAEIRHMLVRHARLLSREPKSAQGHGLLET